MVSCNQFGFCCKHKCSSEADGCVPLLMELTPTGTATVPGTKAIFLLTYNPPFGLDPETKKPNKSFPAVQFLAGYSSEAKT